MPVNWTDRPASMADDIPKVRTRRVELPGSGGAPPIIVTIRPIPPLLLPDVSGLRGEPDGSPRAAEVYRAMAKAAIVEPADFSFEPTGNWDALSGEAVVLLLAAITELTNEGVSEVTQAEAGFPGGEPGGAEAVPAGGPGGEAVAASG